MSAADIAAALGDARREDRTWRLLCRLRHTFAIKNYLRPTPPPEQQTAAPVGGRAASSASRSPHQNGLKSEAPMPRVRKHGIGDCITS